jgi:Sec-independent protein secretion pathway component TatC
MMKWIAIIALLSAATFWDYAPTYELPLRFVVGLGAILVATQAVRAKRKPWAIGFWVIAAVFNPFASAISMTGKPELLAVIATAVAFTISLMVLKPQPLLSIPSITDRTPGSVSL